MNAYTVMIETTPNKASAKKRFELLKSRHIHSRIATLHLDNQTYYSVQAGPFTQRKEALTQLDAIKKLGIRHAFITRNAQ
ncbi:SPOR domain-containing protein [Pullulanibacillus sp. KACC 23026]|uniref:SPOR domain-containing protein n=1 Tax=Pullulanibacillus sp. KACC 23026 TaxID=3028315 RepID=UPI0023AF31E8|nr:SPOR domain-containing protein [Pullulanibacillus sp. KACC 23026]WEG11281.1 SPOR domain-containing protein [Pullulanibacillus sp. KACC 23026]